MTASTTGRNNSNRQYSKHMTNITISFRKPLTLLAMAAALLTSCSQDDSAVSANNGGAMPLKVLVGQAGWGAKSATRATYSSHSLSGGCINLPMDFTSGDAIGIYAVDETGKVTVANRKYYYDGTQWTSDDPIENYLGLYFCDFFAYYPWKESPTGAPAAGSTQDITSADTFFAGLVTAWTPSADQSTLAAFTGSDLMTAKGTVSHAMVASFTLAHRMGLLITKPVLSFYDYDNPSDTWTVTQSFTGSIPYAIGDFRYYLAKPGLSVTLGSKTTTMASGQAEQLYFSSGEPSHR